jgi:two-component system, cell cycle sensor histidine kinase and response regulator CckA
MRSPAIQNRRRLFARPFSLRAQMLMGAYARNGREALKLYRNYRDEIPLVILDMIIPEMDGYPCLQELLKIDPNARGLPAGGFPAHRGAGVTVEPGSKGFLWKPHNINGMRQAVRKTLVM